MWGNKEFITTFSQQIPESQKRYADICYLMSRGKHVLASPISEVQSQFLYKQYCQEAGVEFVKTGQIDNQTDIVLYSALVKLLQGLVLSYVKKQFSPTLLFVTSQYAQDLACARLLLRLADGEQFEDEVFSAGVI